MKDQKHEDRIQNFQKSSFSLLETREKFKTNLRKNKIEEYITRKRVNSAENENTKLEITPDSLKISDEIRKQDHSNIEDFFTQILNLMNSDDINLVKFGIFLLRQYCSKQRSLPVDLILEKRIPLCMNNLLSKHILDNSIVYEILWCFTNLTCEDDLTLPTELTMPRYIENYLKLFNTCNVPGVIQQLIWLLGNMVGNNEPVKDILRDSKIIHIILDLLSQDCINGEIVKNGIWFIATFQKPIYETDEKLLEKSVKILCSFLKTNDSSVVCDCLWGLSHISETSNHNIIKIIIDSQLIEALFTYSFANKLHMVTPSIRMIGNLLNDDVIAKDLVRSGCVEFLEQFMNSIHYQIRKECLWCFSNILASDTEYIGIIFDKPLLQRIYSLIRDQNFEVVGEVVYFICVLLHICEYKTALFLIETNIMEHILFFIDKIKESNNLKKLLICLNRFLSLSEGDQNGETNLIINSFINLGGIEILQNLSDYPVNEIAKLSEDILDKYFICSFL